MKFCLRTLDDVNVFNKTVLCRIDINEPLDTITKKLNDTSRIDASLTTIRELQEKGVKTILLAHQGSDIEYKNYYSLYPHYEYLKTKITGIHYIDDICGPAALEKIKTLPSGECLLLENVRFLAEEQTLFEKALQLSYTEQAQTLLVRRLTSLGDIYVCDAFAAAHRKQPSLCGFQQHLCSCMGRLFEHEYEILSSLVKNPKYKCVFILGGAKVEDAFMVMQAVLKNNIADTILTGGLVANILTLTQGYTIGEASAKYIYDSGYENCITTSELLLKNYSEKITIPKDFAYVKNGLRREISINTINNTTPALVDIGMKTAIMYSSIINSARTVFANGPMGIFEQNISEEGTKKVFSSLAESSAYTIAGGGDTIAALQKYSLADKINYISTGGGAFIRFISGEILPVIDALKMSVQK